MTTFSEVSLKIKAIKKTLSSQRSLVLGVIVLLAAGFMAYRNFSQPSGTTSEELKIESANVGLGDLGDIAGGATSPEINQKTFGVGAVAGEKTALQAPTETWVARSMEKDSLKEANSYKVQKGDTLWEIAEAKYGSGFEWKKILEANKDKVGFLPNGSQARIEIGQELTLP